MKGALEKSSSVAPALLSTENDDGTFVLVELRIRWELGPVVSVWLPARGRTAQNLAVRPDVVFNLPPDGTGTEEGASGMPHSTDAPWTEPSELVRPPRLVHCPVQLEARRVGERTVTDGAWTQVEAQVLRVHADPRWVLPLGDGRIDLGAWHPPVHDFRPPGTPPPQAVPASAQEMARQLGRRFPAARGGS
ncbi:hypothetical protein SLV14_005908 [Streptomyces sp. Je 1-4]|uniref:hypothetical protein n=1 Tax=Streptomyces TaxID=1883 RepID=UPI0021DA17DB|nr:MULTISPECIES: hypothetical protein [unclassified Streptomyces]UYB42983.1 hypothetical protein SLV14_005908 [Streptomyces sp. Je 1-4]UZQ39329.1 hypothetical protein SLV14N_005908 [Streptomyces sp. Je 1-4] [Streptomyces sp. Je 1-4 4N24]UZQ46746.1 hypothetical protein SLV14NA_005908 [Streptomyces sp. Je 1-4] [Streptomyces sp. Je 1-4 4N24_ara]